MAKRQIVTVTDTEDDWSDLVVPTTPSPLTQAISRAKEIESQVDTLWQAGQHEAAADREIVFVAALKDVWRLLRGGV